MSRRGIWFVRIFAVSLSYVLPLSVFSYFLFALSRQQASQGWDKSVVFEPAVWGILFRTQAWAWSVASLLGIVALPGVYLFLRDANASVGRYILLITIACSVSEIVRVLALSTLLDHPYGGTAFLPDLFTKAAAVAAFAYVYGPLAFLLFWLSARELKSEDILIAESLGAKWYSVILRVIVPSRLSLFFLVTLVITQYVATDLLVPKLVGGSSLSTFATLSAFYSLQARQAETGLAISLAQMLLTAVIGLGVLALARRVFCDD